MPGCSASTRRPPFRPLTGGIACSHSRRCRVERHEFEYKRHGTTPLYGALNVRTGEMQGKTTDRRTSLDFVVFLREGVATCPPNEEIHVILDNLSAHKTKLVETFLDEHFNVTLHFTPMYSTG